MDDYRFSIFAVPFGVMGVVCSPSGLHMIILPRKNEEEVKSYLDKHYAVPLTRREEALKGFRKKLLKYFAGEKVVFKEKLDLKGATPFELKVWDATLSIPWGEVRSYDWLAKKVGVPEGRQAVGAALKRNRLPLIVPCHRVIAKNGSLGGFLGGVAMKRELLKLEGRIW